MSIRHHPLYRLATVPFTSATVENLTEFALLIWYSDDLRAQDVMGELVGHDVAQRRALYLIDRFRRYPCLTSARAAKLKSFVSEWASLKVSLVSGATPNLKKGCVLDKVAREWGLDEDIVAKIKPVLFYQTRHYASSVAARSGYEE